MSTPIAENPAVTDPRKTLTKTQQEALGALDFFRHRYQRRNGWQIGRKVYPAATIAALEKRSLVRSSGDAIDLTIAGKLAADRLKGKKP